MRRAWCGVVPRGMRETTRGIAAVETLLAAPIVLLLGLTVLQWALVFHGRQAVSHAAVEGARAGSVDHASGRSIASGIARGLAPWLYGASGPEDFAASLARTESHLAGGAVAGWAVWRRLAPTPESFADWAQTARDADGNPIPGLLEIPNDNLAIAGGGLLPASGVAGYRGVEPIGSVSGQTLADANLLKIELVYGVPLSVPLVGRFSAWVMSAVDGCDSSEASGSRRLALGAVDFGRPRAGAWSRTWACAHYRANDDAGRPSPRWPVKVSATIRMQSPARDADAGEPRSGERFGGEALGAGTVDGAKAFEPIPIDRTNPGGAGPTLEGSVDRAPGFLKIGGDRLLEPPGMCVAQ